MGVTARQLARNCVLTVSLTLALLDVPCVMSAQTSVGTGSIIGTIRDPSGVAVGGANVTITNRATGQPIALTANSSGAFNSGALVPGSYKALVAAKGFASTVVLLTVQLGNTATVNVKLQIGPETQVGASFAMSSVKSVASWLARDRDT